MRTRVCVCVCGFGGTGSLRRTQVVFSILIRRQRSLAWVAGRCRNYIWLAWALTLEENSEAPSEVSSHNLINPPQT